MHGAKLRSWNQNPTPFTDTGDDKPCTLPVRIAAAVFTVVTQAHGGEDAGMTMSPKPSMLNGDLPARKRFVSTPEQPEWKATRPCATLTNDAVFRNDYDLQLEFRKASLKLYVNVQSMFLLANDPKSKYMVLDSSMHNLRSFISSSPVCGGM